VFCMGGYKYKAVNAGKKGEEKGVFQERSRGIY